MCTRGIFQLKKLNVWFCNSSVCSQGSSEGTRLFLESEQLKQFMENNKQIEFNFLMKKNQHPYVSSTYINGYRKDVSLKNVKEFDEILNKMTHMRNTDGSKPYLHAGKKVFTTKPSIQGGWKQNMWDQYPIHEMERNERFEEPQFTYKKVPILRPSEEERRTPDIQRKLLRSKRYFYENQPPLG